MKKFITSTLACLAIFLSFGQAVIENRLEIESKETTDETIDELGEDGFLFSYEKSESKKERTLYFDFYNTNLELDENVKTTIPWLYYYENQFKHEKMIYQLHRDRRNNFIFVTVDAAKRTLETFKGKLPEKIKFTEIKVLNNKCYLYGYKVNNFSFFGSSKKYLFTLDLKTKKIKSIPLNFGDVKLKNISLENCQLLEDAEEVIFSFKVYPSRLEREIHAMVFDKKGDRDQFVVHKSGSGEENLVNFSFTKIGKEAYSLAGTYSKSSSSSSEGLFFAIIDDQKVQNINYYNFLDLEDFLSYLPEKKQEKIEKKKKRKKNRGKELAFDYNIASHDVIKKDDGTFIFIGEAYYPTYVTHTTVNADGTTTTTQVFDGYQYTHAVIAKFNLEGELIWDNCFKMFPGYKPFHEKRFLQVNEEDDKNLSMIFVSTSRITSKSVDLEDGTITREVESEKIELDEDVKLKYSRPDISYWYEDNYLMYGMQTIKDKKAKIGNRKKTIFFISKVNYKL